MFQSCENEEDAYTAGLTLTFPFASLEWKSLSSLSFTW